MILGLGEGWQYYAIVTTASENPVATVSCAELKKLHSHLLTSYRYFLHVPVIHLIDVLLAIPKENCTSMF